MTATPTELLPCRHCGSDEVGGVADKEQDTDNYILYMQCQKCRASGPHTTLTYPEGEFHLSTHEAARLWNRRTPPLKPQITREMAHKIARTFAVKRSGRKDYTYQPNSSTEAAKWNAHEWVVEAIMYAGNLTHAASAGLAVRAAPAPAPEKAEAQAVARACFVETALEELIQICLESGYYQRNGADNDQRIQKWRDAILAQCANEPTNG